MELEWVWMAGPNGPVGHPAWRIRTIWFKLSGQMVVNSDGSQTWKSGDWVAIQMFHHALYASYAFYGDLHNPKQFLYLVQYQSVA